MFRWTPFCSPFTDRHTGDRIQEVVDMDLEGGMDLDPEMPKWGTSDNASNMVKAINNSSVELYCCLNHTQQLAIKDTFKRVKDKEDNETMADIADKCRKLSDHVKRADNSRKLLYKECEVISSTDHSLFHLSSPFSPHLPSPHLSSPNLSQPQVTKHYPKALPVANDTRWDSTYSCMEGILYHEECFHRLARRGELVVEKDGEEKNLIPSIANFLMMKAGVKVLKLCKETTKVFEQEKVPTVPLVTKRLYTMATELKEIAKDKTNKKDNPKAAEFAKVLDEELEKRFPEYGTTNLVNSMSNYLNPRLKGVHLKLLGKMEEVKEDMEEKLGEWRKEKEDEVKVVQEEEMEKEAPKKLSPTEMLKKRMKDQEEKAKGRKAKKSSTFRNTSEKQVTQFTEECDKYETVLKEAEEDEDILGWWRTHKDALPLSPTWPGWCLLCLQPRANPREYSVWRGTS